MKNHSLCSRVQSYEIKPLKEIDVCINSLLEYVTNSIVQKNVFLEPF